MPENHIDQALEEFRVALSMDPLSPIVNMNYGLTLLVAHRNSEALAQFDKILERDPGFVPAHFYLSQAYLATGRYPDAVSELEKTPQFAGVSATRDLPGYLKLMLEPAAPGPPTNIAVTYAVAGNGDKAFEYLEKAHSQQDSELMACIRFPAFDSLHRDPRWADLMRRVGLP